MLMFYLSLMDTPEERDWITYIYEEYHSFVINIANGILHNIHDSEDAVHTAYLDVIAHKEKYSNLECSVFRATFVVIVKNKVIDIYRKRKKIDDIPVDERYDLSTSDDILKQIVTQEGFESLVNSMEKIPAQYQEILQLKFFSKATNSEISQKLGIKLKNVETRLYRAKLSLKKVLLEESE